MKMSHSAGGIVLNKQRQVAVVSQGGETWCFPKGRIGWREKALATAIREIGEETGLTRLRYIADLGSYQRTTYTRRRKIKRDALKTITMFLFETDETELKPTDRLNPEALWLSKDEALGKLSHPADKAWFSAIIEKIGL